MTQSEQILNQILVKIQQNSLQNKRSLVVFDLDSTLFDVSPRTEKILREFHQHPMFLNDFQHLEPLFANVRAQHGDWGVKDALLRVDFSQHLRSLEERKKLETAIRDFWFERFFSNEYLHYDEPYAGAADFVQTLNQYPLVDIVYLTGRDVYRMGKGSKEVLVKWNFPLDDHKCQLVLKPKRDLDDALFKFQWFEKLPSEKYNYISFFENEPVNVNRVREKLSHVEIVFFDSTHSRREDVFEPILRIDTYSIKTQK